MPLLFYRIWRYHSVETVRLVNIREAVQKCAKDCNASSILQFQNRHVFVTDAVLRLLQAARQRVI